MFPDVAEALSLGHLGRGDVTSALVAAEWYMRNNQFPGWGRPNEFAADLYRRVGKREEECRDVARLALRAPWWSLRSYEDCVSMAQLSGAWRWLVCVGRGVGGCGWVVVGGAVLWVLWMWALGFAAWPVKVPTLQSSSTHPPQPTHPPTNPYQPPATPRHPR